MTLANVVILLAAAAIHVTLHAFIKRAKDGSAFLWWMLLWNVILYTPLLLHLGLPPREAWPFIAARALLEAIFLVAMTRAYGTTDFSIVYPLARGSAPLFLLIWSLLFLRERITIGGALGVATITIGIYVVAHGVGGGNWLAPLRALRSGGPRWALLAGLVTSVYTALDKVGVRETHPLVYLYGVMLTTLLMVSGPMLRRAPMLIAEWRASRWWTVAAGALMPLSYALVLLAMRRGTPASYAGSVREVGIVLAAIGGAIMGEPIGPGRVAGALLIALGVATIAVVG